jgi:hypothetical protein
VEATPHGEGMILVHPKGTQLPTAETDSLGMNREHADGAYVDAIYAILWIGALLAATDEIVDPFPDHVVRVAEMYFRCFPPLARA